MDLYELQEICKKKIIDSINIYVIYIYVIYMYINFVINKN